MLAAVACSYTHARAIKLKLTGEEIDAERVRAVRRVKPEVWIGVDANQGFTREFLERLLPVLMENQVKLIEQPFPIGQEAQLDGLKSPIPIAADETVQSLSDISRLDARFNVVNIKLDKCGGLTEGLALAQDVAREFGLRVYAMRREIGFDSLSLPIDEALSRALATANPPVVVADQSDNPGGGAPGDATFALRWLLDAGARDVAMAMFYDPEVVRIAKKAGPGTTLRVRLGGKMGPFSGDPVDIEVHVLSMRDNYMHVFPQQSDEPMSFPAGSVVALRHGDIDLIVSSERCQCMCPSIFRDLGIDLSCKQVKHLEDVLGLQAVFPAAAPDHAHRMAKVPGSE